MKKFTMILILFLFITSFYSSKELTSISEYNNILYVGGSGPNNYTKIQDAIDDALPGDTIFVYSGVYYENVRIYKSINLIGENEETTIIDGRNESDVTVFSIEADNVKFSHFTIRNISSEPFVYGITASGKNLTISNCIIRNADGLMLRSAENIVIENCNFSNNYWGIFFLTKCRNIVIKNCTLTHNLGKKWGEGYRGGEGISFMFDAKNFYNISILNCNASDNRFCGIGVYRLENIVIKNCTLLRNSRGIHLYGVENVSVTNCEIRNNINYGIAIVASYGNISIKNCNITGNDLAGIMILLKEKGDINIEACNIKNNYFGLDISISYGLHINNPMGMQVHYCNIYGNEIGMYARPFTIVNARYNYWGSPLGPSVLFKLRGDKIETFLAKVIYFPWLMEEYG